MADIKKLLCLALNSYCYRGPVSRPTSAHFFNRSMLPIFQGDEDMEEYHLFIYILLVVSLSFSVICDVIKIWLLR